MQNFICIIQGWRSGGAGGEGLHILADQKTAAVAFDSPPQIFRPFAVPVIDTQTVLDLFFFILLLVEYLQF